VRRRGVQSVGRAVAEKKQNKQSNKQSNIHQQKNHIKFWNKNCDVLLYFSDLVANSNKKTLSRIFLKN
jgi:hypothetical protein